MAYEPKDLTGSLFKNEKEAENHPDYKGQALIDGVPYWVAGWIKPTKDGSKFMSLSFRVKDAKPQPVKEKQKTFKPDEEIPF